MMAVSEWWIRRRIASGELRARRVGGPRRSVYRIWGPDLARFVLDTTERPQRES
jgi:hypothetical protein